MPRDEYGDIPGQGGNQWAYDDSVIPESDLHIGGTMTYGGGTISFWMTRPRPQGVSYEDWEKITQANWDRIFKGEKSHARD
jgi:hypothetical protein